MVKKKALSPDYVDPMIQVKRASKTLNKIITYRQWLTAHMQPYKQCKHSNGQTILFLNSAIQVSSGIYSESIWEA